MKIKEENLNKVQTKEILIAKTKTKIYKKEVLMKKLNLFEKLMMIDNLNEEKSIISVDSMKLLIEKNFDHKRRDLVMPNTSRTSCHK